MPYEIGHFCWNQWDRLVPSEWDSSSNTSPNKLLITAYWPMEIYPHVLWPEFVLLKTWGTEGFRASVSPYFLPFCFFSIFFPPVGHDNNVEERWINQPIIFFRASKNEGRGDSSKLHERHRQGYHYVERNGGLTSFRNFLWNTVARFFLLRL